MTGAMLLTGKEMQGAQVRNAIWATLPPRWGWTMFWVPLIRYLVLMPLKHVVSPRSEVQEGLLNHSHHEPARQDMLKYLFKNSKRLRSKSLIIRNHSSTQNLLFITWTPDLASLQRTCCSHSIGTCRTHWSSNSRRSDKSLLSWI